MFSTSSIYAQIQIGSDITGSEDNDATGRTVAISADGSIVATSGHFYGSNNGQLRVFSLQSEEWTQIGQTFEGAPFQQLGGRMTLSGDGSMLAMNSGSIKVFHYDNGSWNQIGQSLVEENIGEGFGSQIALSYNGDYLAVGTNQSNIGGSRSGAIRVFQLTGGAWIKIGEDIPGPSAGSELGDAIAISDDGQTVIGGMLSNDEIASNSGKAQVFRYSANEWTQLGQDINGLGTWDFLGAAVDISGNGTVIGVTCADGIGETCLFELSGGSWLRMGECLEGFETSLALSYDGQIVAVGEDGASPVGRSSGKGALYRFNSNEWEQVGEDVTGDQQDDYFGRAIALSADGQVMAVGATRSRIGDTRPGFIRVYDMIAALPVNLLSFEVSAIGKSAKLNWVTTSEINNEKFIVEYSDDSQNWVQIGEVLSQLISNSSLYEYSFSHNPQVVGTSYYRLVQIDFNGDQTYSDIKAVNFGYAEVNIYPNPTTNFLALESDQSFPITALSIYHLNGQLVRVIPNATREIFVGDLSKGNYLINFIYGTDRISRKFTVE